MKRKSKKRLPGCRIMGKKKKLGENTQHFPSMKKRAMSYEGLKAAKKKKGQFNRGVESAEIP